jgi:hypothetical protein
MTTAVSPPGPAPDLIPSKVDDPTPLRAVHTPNLPALLRQLGASLLVTTRQAGQRVRVRDERPGIVPTVVIGDALRDRG